MKQLQAAEYLKSLHTLRPLVLPNAWDVASARIIERSGARAIATTSAGIAWVLGRSDGQGLSRDEMIDMVGRIVRSVSVPVTADVEGGYGNGSTADVAQTVRMLVALGVAGMNLEDSSTAYDGTLMPSEQHAERILAARESAASVHGDLLINARIDVYLNDVGAPESRFAEAVRRGTAYRAAGADCIFVPGVTDKDTIARLVHEIDAPMSVGPSIAMAALATAPAAACELLGDGTYTTLEQNAAFEELSA